MTPLKPVDADQRPVGKMVKGPNGLMQFPDGVKLTRDYLHAVAASRAGATLLTADRNDLESLVAGLPIEQD